MSDFNQAIKWLKEGKKVRREDWDEGCFYILLSQIEYQNLSGHDEEFDVFMKDDFEANDWEIYEEKKEKPNLGLATTRELIEEVKARIEIDGKLDYKTVNAIYRKRTRDLNENVDRLQEIVYEIEHYDKEMCEKFIHDAEKYRECQKRGHNLSRWQLLEAAGLSAAISIIPSYALCYLLF